MRAATITPEAWADGELDRLVALARRVGVIGHLSATDASAARAVLRQACRGLAEQGCTRVLAPMDGNTWTPYRCRTGAPLGFAGEPVPGPEWIAHLHGCGFKVVEAHRSGSTLVVQPGRRHAGLGASRPRGQRNWVKPQRSSASELVAEVSNTVLSSAPP